MSQHHRFAGERTQLVVTVLVRLADGQPRHRRSEQSDREQPAAPTPVPSGDFEGYAPVVDLAQWRARRGRDHGEGPTPGPAAPAPAAAIGLVA